MPLTSDPRFLENADLPLKGLKVLELSHMIMGPVAGLILADLGAEVVKVEPVQGDRTRQLKGAGTGFFSVFNRNKQSLAIDLKTTQGKDIVRKLALKADFFVENFKDDSLKSLGLDYESLKNENPRLIYLSLKGFGSGPYKQRTALDEVVQMMGGMAHINGGNGTPQRVAPSANDILGGTFAVVGALAALNDRHTSGKGKHVRAGLFETNLLMVSQFIAQYQLTGTPPPPMAAERKPAWGIYDIFETADNRVFVAVVSDVQWRNFAKEFLSSEWAQDPRLQTANDRQANRSWLVPAVAEVLKTWKTEPLCAKLEALGLSFGPIRQPHDLLEDVHLKEGGGLLHNVMPNGQTASAGALPIEFDGRKFGKRSDPPAIGASTEAILQGLGLSQEAIAQLHQAGIVAN
ncbi:MAG: CoA transferase [Betaproteobacteria bacterium]|jgi:crotonobetainyl-CoA:carnitine CoA-transferase CaiB-like acyl-CoA transferase|nr:CaiB/BaiF CoA-transferase family protein [Burkholderiales bacterium]NBX14170.1 CoA transferase [Betaproteobacteria bacterium]NBX90240.1 CoA transferase [Betaproteobacteria bacterium]